MHMLCFFEAEIPQSIVEGTCYAFPRKAMKQAIFDSKPDGLLMWNFSKFGIRLISEVSALVTSEFEEVDAMCDPT